MTGNPRPPMLSTENRPVDIHIENLVVRGLGEIAAEQLQGVVQKELVRLFDSEPSRASRIGELRAQEVAGLSISTGNGTQEIGVSLAEALFNHLTSGADR